MICPNCDGTGKKSYGPQHSSAARILIGKDVKISDGGVEPCFYCNGTGQLPDSTRTEGDGMMAYLFGGTTYVDCAGCGEKRIKWYSKMTCPRCKEKIGW